MLTPYLRGYGPTRFRDRSAPRMAEQAAIGQDVIDLADALELEQFALPGFDWGNRAACITAILHPEKVRAQVAIGRHSVQNTVTRSSPGPPAADRARFTSLVARRIVDGAWHDLPAQTPDEVSSALLELLT